MLINFDKELQKIKDVRSGKIKEGLKLDNEILDERIRFKRQFNVILGHANVGKTSVILYLMLLYTIKHKLKWLVYSSENESYTLIKKLVEFLENKPINKIQDFDFNNQVLYINDHFKFIDTTKLYDYKSLLQTAIDIKKTFDYDGFLIDPYNSLTKNKELHRNISSHDYDYHATSLFRIFSQKYNCAVWLNTHANTDALRKIHPHSHYYAGLPMPPMAADVEGGGKFVNRADDFWVLHRYIQHPSEWMYSHLHIRKVKNTDTGGRPTAIDNPITLKSVLNNTGFEINNKNLLPLRVAVQKKLPF